MRSVEMGVEYPIEDSNLPMPHLIALAGAAFVEEAERQSLLLMSPATSSVLHGRRVVEVRADIAEKPDWEPPTPAAPTFACPHCGTTIFATGQSGQEETEK